jgi:exonuclease SbcC
MIEKLSIKAFQAHQKLVLELDPHVTTIIGPSDVGKSSILRALRWVVLNQPSGDAFVRWGEKRARVQVSVDGECVDRERSSTVNTYRLASVINQTIPGVREFKSFSTGVPDEVAVLLGMDEINFQGQYDCPFWLGDAAGEVSRHLNLVVGLEVIDQVFSKLTALTRKRQAEVSVVEDRLASAKAERQQWNFAKEMSDELCVLERLEESFQDVGRSIIELSRVLREYQSGQELRDKALRIAQSGSSVLEVGEALTNSMVQCDELESLIREMRVQQRMRSLAASIPSDEGLVGVKEIVESVEKLKALIGSLGRATLDKGMAEKDVIHLSHRWHRDMGEVCGLCGQKIER